MTHTPSSTLGSNLLKSLKIFLALALIIVLKEGMEEWFGISFRENSLFGFGFLMVAGVFGGQLSASIGLPRITGFLIAGFAVGPSATGLLTTQHVADLKNVNQLALAMIALQAGCELTREMLTNNFRKVLRGSMFHILIIGLGTTLALYLVRGHVDFMQPFSPLTTVLLCWLLATIAISKSPSAVVAVLSETKAKGPLTEYSLGMVVLLDIVVLGLFSFAMAAAEPAVTGIGSMSLSVLWSFSEELFLSVAAGTFFGVLIIIYLKLIQKERLLFLVVMCFGVSALTTYLHYDTMLVFVIAGLTVTQFSSESAKMIATIEDLSSVIMILFFATAGASLHLSEVQSLWGLAMFLVAVRGGLTIVSELLTHRQQPKGDVLRRYGATPFFSQAGLTIGLAALLETRLPVVGPQLATLAIAVVSINQVFGPVLNKWGLARAGEIPKNEPTS